MKIGVLSDAHGHVGAFEAGLAALRRAGAERLYFLGDAVGYIPDPGVAERLRDRGIAAIKGNHETMMFADDYPAEREPAYQLQATRAGMDEATQAFLRSLAPRAEDTLDGLRCLFVHGSPADPTFGYVYPDTELAGFAGLSAGAVFMGHTHRPFVRECNGTLFVNVGSCALPRDGDGRGAACVFDTAQRRAEIVRFDISAESRAVLDRYSLHESVAAALKRSVSTVSHA
jgi:predicted phosphodiesterase